MTSTFNNNTTDHVEINMGVGEEVQRTTSATSARPSRRDLNSRNEERNRSRTRSRNGNRNSDLNNRSPNRNRRDVESAINDAIPLLPVNESDLPKQKPPLAGPELDDSDTPEENNGSDDTGIDDGFLSPRPKPKPEFRPTNDRRNGGIPKRRDSLPPNFPKPPEFPYPPDFGPGVISVSGETPRIIPDVNVYQQKKTLAQGMMDLALLSANANQLRYVLESYPAHPYFYVSLGLISTSLIIQIVVGIGLIWNSRYNVKRDNDICKADRINNLTVIGIFVITVVNVLISAFGVAEMPSGQPIQKT